MKQVVILDYGAGNTFSVEQALRRLGVEPFLTADKEVVLSASHVVFPGVGHASAAMEQLKASGLDSLIPQLKQPVLGICLGMQLLCRYSEEGQINGLGVFNSMVERFSQDFIVPHMGWNDVEFEGGQTESFYFVHGYKATICKDTWGVCDYGTPFSAALRRDNFTGVQFHPEKSGEAGAKLIQQFLALK